MSNSRLLHMYGFSEESNSFDDAFIYPNIIKDTIKTYVKDATDAKIKLLDNHGFFDQGLEKILKCDTRLCTQHTTLTQEFWTNFGLILQFLGGNLVLKIGKICPKREQNSFA